MGWVVGWGGVAVVWWWMRGREGVWATYLFCFIPCSNLSITLFHHHFLWWDGMVGIRGGVVGGVGWGGVGLGLAGWDGWGGVGWGGAQPCALLGHHQ